MAEVEKYGATQVWEGGTLPRFEGKDWEDHISAWAESQKAEALIQFYRGAIAASVNTVYGESSMEKFAYDTGADEKTLWEYARIYRRLEGLEESDRSDVLMYVEEGPLSYTHLLRANAIEEDEEYVRTLTEAHDNSWSTRRMSLERSQKDWTPPNPEPVPEQEGEVIEGEVVVEAEVEGEVVYHYRLYPDSKSLVGGKYPYRVVTRTGEQVTSVLDYDDTLMQQLLKDANRGYSLG